MSFRSWGPKQNGVAAATISSAGTQVSVATPTGFSQGGDQVRIVNAASGPVIVAFYKNASGVPTLTMPTSGSISTPPSGRPDMCFVVVPANGFEQITVPDLVDSFAVNSASSGATGTVYVQRGDGSF